MSAKNVSVYGARPRELSEQEHVLVAAAQRGPLSDIVFVGFLDGPAKRRQFHPMMRDIYIELGGVLIMLSSAENHSAVAISYADEVACNFEIDEDDEFCVSSVIELFLRAPFANSRIERIDLFRQVEHAGGAVTLKGIGFSLETTEYLVVDPLNYFGVQLRPMNGPDIWLEQNSPAQLLSFTIAEGREPQRS